MDENRARSAQIELTKLEKDNAPIKQQIKQAALFAGAAIDSLQIRGTKSNYHGRQDWTLKWLLKKLAADTTARAAAESWVLLRQLVDRVPLKRAAASLNERSFVSTLKSAVEELRSRTVAEAHGQASSSTPSKKRKRTGEAVQVAIDTDASQTYDLALQIQDAISTIIELGKAGAPERFDMETMRSVIKTSAEDAAKILGAWLDITKAIRHELHTDPFIEIWEYRAPGSEDSTVFAQQCLNSTLILLTDSPSSSARLKDHISQNEQRLTQLVAKYCILPAKSAYQFSKTPELFKAMIADMPNKDLQYPLIFDIAIRCISAKDNRKRKSQDILWLQAVFSALKEAIDTDFDTDRTIAIKELLAMCLIHDVKLDLEYLRELAKTSACNDDVVDWNLVSIILKLDSNVFLIANEDRDLSPALLHHISNASYLDSYPQFVDTIIDQVVIPLIGEFASVRRLRDLAQMIYNEIYTSMRSEDRSSTTNSLVWEDEAIKAKFQQEFEGSLDTRQILQLVEFLESKISECPEAVFVVADLVAGAIKKEDNIDAVDLRIWKLISSSELMSSLDSRFCGKGWSAIRSTFEFKTPATRVASWQAARSEALNIAKSAVMKSPISETIVKPGSVGMFNCLCALYASRLMAGNEQEVILGLLNEFDNPLQKLFSQALQNVQSHGWLIAKAVNSHRDDIPGQINISAPISTRVTSFAYARALLVEYPVVLQLFLKSSQGHEQGKVKSGRKNGLSQSLIHNLIWLSSPPEITASSSPLDVEPQYASYWSTLFESECFRNTESIFDPLIEVLLRCSSYEKSPLHSSKGCNGFVVKSLLRIPDECFSKPQRETILRSWLPKASDGTMPEIIASSYGSADLAPAIFSLKMKIMNRPMLYEGAKFQDLIKTSEAIAEYCQKPNDVTPVFADFTQRTLEHAIATMDQSRSREYLVETVEAATSWLQKNKKAKKTLLSPMIKLIGVVIFSLRHKATALETIGITTGTALKNATDLVKGVLLLNLEHLLEKPGKLEVSEHGKRSSSLLVTLSTLNKLEIAEQDIAVLANKSRQTIAAVANISPSLGARLEVFLTQFAPSSFASIDSETLLHGDISTEVGRQAVETMARSVVTRLEDSEKLRLVLKVLDTALADASKLDGLLAVRAALESCEDSKDVTVGIDGLDRDLSSIYTMLIKKLPQSGGFRQFCLISETLDWMLRVKGRSISQYNIDCTMSAISILCSPRGPALPPKRAGTIFLHACHLLTTALLSHRLKLQGRLHLVVQTLQPLLRTLFTPTSPSAAKSSLLPPWITQTSHHLTTPHAQAYTRLLTLLCDPSTSSVSRSSSSALNSATARAKALVSQDLPLVISCYISLQLNMGLRMGSEVRSALVPGVWAVFDTMSVEGRRVLGESMDASGRRILSELIREWSKFGKWKGS